MFSVNFFLLYVLHAEKYLLRFIPAILVCSTRASKKVDSSDFFGSCERFSSVGSSSKDMRISAYNAEMSMSPRRVDSAPACCLSRSETSVSFRANSPSNCSNV